MFPSAVWRGCWPPAALLAAKSEATIKFQPASASSHMTQEVFRILLTHHLTQTHTIRPRPHACSLCRKIFWILAYMLLLLARSICVVQGKYVRMPLSVSVLFFFEVQGRGTPWQHRKKPPCLHQTFFHPLLSVLFYETFLYRLQWSGENKAGNKPTGEVTGWVTAVLGIPQRLKEE